MIWKGRQEHHHASSVEARRTAVTACNSALRKNSHARGYAPGVRRASTTNGNLSDLTFSENTSMFSRRLRHPILQLCSLRNGLFGLILLLTLAGTVACTMPAHNTRRSLTNNMPHDYIIGAGDVLEILVWKNEDISKVVTVRPDGKISLPLINDVQAAGFTPMELRNHIADALKKYKDLPEVSVIVKEASSQVVYLMGEVVKPGTYPLGPNATVIQVIAQGGGFTPYADRNNITVLRHEMGSAKEQHIQVSYKSILSGRSDEGNITLRAGDTIIVP
jgi:polysaccharide export outer membrane protein